MNVPAVDTLALLQLSGYVAELLAHLTAEYPNRDNAENCYKADNKCLFDHAGTAFEGFIEWFEILRYILMFGHLTPLQTLDELL